MSRSNLSPENFTPTPGSLNVNVSYPHSQRTWRSLMVRMVGYTLALFFILGPLSSLLIWSFAEKWYWPGALPQEWGFYYWSKVLGAQIWEAFVLSFSIAFGVTFLALVLTIPVAYLIARFQFRWKVLLMLLFLMPQAFPQLPVFTNTMVLLYRWDLVGTVAGVVLIHLVTSLVYGVWTLVAVFQSIPRALEEASVNLGASQMRSFMTVTMPLATPGVIAAGLLIFLNSLDEFTGSLLIGAPFTITLPIYMYHAANGYEMQVASITGLLLMAPGILMLVFLQRYLKAEYLSAFGRI